MNKIIIIEKYLDATALFEATPNDELLISHHLLPVGTEYVLLVRPSDDVGYMLCEIDSYIDGVIKVTHFANVDVQNSLDGRSARYTSVNALGIDLSEIQFNDFACLNLVRKRVMMLFELPFFGPDRRKLIEQGFGL
jgi:hypothetical protein